VVQHLNQVELSRRWRLSTRTLERWRLRGTGPHYLKVGGRIVYRLADIDAFEAERLCNPAAKAAARMATPLRLVRA
jgi:helix-turn-helix protein